MRRSVLDARVPARMIGRGAGRLHAHSIPDYTLPGIAMKTS